MKLPKETLHRFVPHHQAMDYVRLGWLPLPSLRQTPHDAYSVHVIWLCDCVPHRPATHAGHSHQNDAAARMLAL